MPAKAGIQEPIDGVDSRSFDTLASLSAGFAWDRFRGNDRLWYALVKAAVTAVLLSEPVSLRC
jgi:hypothetical protein